MASNLKVTIERNGKTRVILLREDDYETSTTLHNRPDEIRLHWGPGGAWTVVKTEAAQ